MREYTTPATIIIPDNANLSDAVFANAADFPDNVAFRRKSADGWRGVSSMMFAREVAAVAKGLLAAGVQPGDRVGLMSRTRYEWTLCDYAIWSAGAVTVPIYETSAPEQVHWNLRDSEAVAVIVETAEHAGAVERVRVELPALHHVWQLDGATPESSAIAALTEAGADIDDDELARRRRTATADAMATIIYTSGTTGAPKGCVLTHGNLLFEVASVRQGARQLFHADASTLLFLPLAHVFARLIQCGCVVTRAQMGHTADIKNLVPDLQSFRPSFVLSVPRVFEKVYNTARQSAHADGKGAIFDRAEAVAIAYSKGLDKRGAGLATKAQHAVFDRLVYAKLRTALGGQVQYAVSGGAPLGERLGHFFRGVGLPVLEGYGLTETSAGATMNLPDTLRVGTVGRPVPGASVAIADDGEVLLKGGHVFRGYWRNDAATALALDSDGWLATGDVGALDDQGFLRITGRKKELIVTAAGKNVAPAPLEDRLRAHPLIDQCMVIGDARPFIGCLITIDPDAFVTWKAGHDKPAQAGVAQLRDDADLRAEIDAAIADANSTVSHAEAIKKYVILPDSFTEEGGQLTPSLKVKRAVVLAQCAREIEQLYAG